MSEQEHGGESKCCRVYDEVNPGCEWVLQGEGKATIKWDGTACAVIGGELFKRFAKGPTSELPVGAICCNDDPERSKRHYWVPITTHASDQWHREPWNKVDAVTRSILMPDGTYELVGPKVNGNKHKFGHHHFRRHDEYVLENVPRTFEGMKAYMQDFNYEGIVFHHEDGRMAKITRKKFGFNW